MLVLLIIFMVTAPLIQQGVAVNLPEARAKAIDAPEQKLVLLKGRLRIHHQFGVEAFGIAEPEQDVECILLQMEFYRPLRGEGFVAADQQPGRRESKERYREVLRAFLEPKSGQLSEDSQRRLVENPLRILDSKDPRDQEACQGAPSAVESLSEKSRKHFERVEELLRKAAVAFAVNPRLVAGFDYYTETLWEVVAGGLGAQNAIGGGGRYDNLVEQLGGRPTPGVGFGSGIERLLLALEGQGVQLAASGRWSGWWRMGTRRGRRISS